MRDLLDALEFPRQQNLHHLFIHTPLASLPHSVSKLGIFEPFHFSGNSVTLVRLISMVLNRWITGFLRPKRMTMEYRGKGWGASSIANPEAHQVGRRSPSASI